MIKTKSFYIALTILMFLLIPCAYSQAADIDIGLRAYDNGQITPIACEEVTPTSPLRISKGNTTYGVVLVDPSHPQATRIRMLIPSGSGVIKAWKKFYTCSGPVKVYDEGDNLVGCYNTIQAGINSTQNNYKVVADPGTYNEDISIPNLTITVRSTQGSATTIINGTHTSSVVIFAEGVTTNTILDGFTIQNGYWDGVAHGGPGGGGITARNASPTIRNCLVRNNTSYNANGGGGIQLAYSNAVISNVQSQNNTANGGLGGGIYMTGGTPSIQNITVTGNQTTNGTVLWAVEFLFGALHQQLTDAQLPGTHQPEWAVELQSLIIATQLFQTAISPQIQLIVPAEEFGHLIILAQLTASH